MITTLLFAVVASVSEAPREVFDAANTAYLQEDYEAASSSYSRLITEFGLQDPVILFNMGNTYHQMGRTGYAVQCYEAALAVNPDFEPAINNRDKVLTKSRRNLPAPDPRAVRQHFLRRYYGLGPAATIRLAGMVLLAALVVLVCREWTANRILKSLALVFPALSMLLFILSLLLVMTQGDTPELAVTTVEEAPVYFSTSESGVPRFILYEGDRILVDRQENEWMRVNAHGGERGWTKKDHIGMVRRLLW